MATRLMPKHFFLIVSPTTNTMICSECEKLRKYFDETYVIPFDLLSERLDIDTAALVLAALAWTENLTGATYPILVNTNNMFVRTGDELTKKIAEVLGGAECQ